MENRKVNVSFLALDPYLERAIPAPVEKRVQGKDMISWGQDNKYPEFLLSLYRGSSTLQSIINGTRDFIVGDSITIAALPETKYAAGVMNTKGDTIRDLVSACATDAKTFGGFALQVIRSTAGKVVEVYACPMRWLRSNKENSVFYYSEKWAKPGSNKVVIYPAFFPFTDAEWAALQPEEKERHYTSILFVKTHGMDTYPSPEYEGAIKACATEMAIDDYHLNAINNGFVSSLIVNFNNGIPDDETKEEIEKDFNEKFTGSQNAGRVMFSWNADRTNAVTITEPKIDNFGERYEALAKHTRQQIFTSFRANPNLFGIPTENLGFSEEEYDSAFRLYNRTAVRPVQRVICEAFERIYGQPNVITIAPFTLDGSGAEKSVQ